MSTPRRFPLPIVAYHVQTCTAYRGGPGEGWETDGHRWAGYIYIPSDAGARAIAREVRGLGLAYDGRKLASLSRAMRSTPYMGGHVDIATRTGKPCGFLERVPRETLGDMGPVSFRPSQVWPAGAWVATWYGAEGRQWDCTIDAGAFPSRECARAELARRMARYAVEGIDN